MTVPPQQAAKAIRPTRRSFLASGAAALVASGEWLPRQAVGAQTPWQDVRQCGPFHCQAEFSLHEYQQLFNELPSLQRELTRILAVEPPREVISLYLFRTQDSYRRYLAARYRNVPYRRALYVKEGGRGSVFAYRHRRMAVDVRHECTHALLHASLPTVPLWLDEGLAEYFEMPLAARSHGHPHLAASRWSYLLGMTRPIEALEAQQDFAQMGTMEYRSAWAWVHFLLHGPYPAFHELVRYVRDIRDSNPHGVFSTRLRRVLPDVDEQIASHFSHWRRPNV